MTERSPNAVNGEQIRVIALVSSVENYQCCRLQIFYPLNLLGYISSDFNKRLDSYITM